MCSELDFGCLPKSSGSTSLIQPSFQLCCWVPRWLGDAKNALGCPKVCNESMDGGLLQHLPFHCIFPLTGLPAAYVVEGRSCIFPLCPHQNCSVQTLPKQGAGIWVWIRGWNITFFFFFLRGIFYSYAGVRFQITLVYFLCQMEFMEEGRDAISIGEWLLTLAAMKCLYVLSNGRIMLWMAQCLNCLVLY